MQDILRGVLVAVQFGPTVWAGVPTHTEVFLDDAPTTTTRLTCIMGSDFHDRATSLFRFIARHRDEGSPSCIQNTLVQAAFGGGSIGNILPIFVLFRFGTRRHVVNMQVLEDQGPVSLDQGLRFFVQKVTATVPHFARQSRQLFLGAEAPVTPLLASVDLLMRCFDLLFRLPIEAGVSNSFSIREHGKGFDAQVNPHGFLRRVKGHGRIDLIFRDENGIPLLPFPFDRTGFDLALDLSMQLDLDLADFGEREPRALEFIAALRVREAIIAVATFETRIAWGLSVQHTTKEGIKSFVESLEHLLLHLRVDVLVLFAKLLDSWKLVRLHAIGDGHSTHLIGISTLLQGSVVQLFAPPQGPFQGPDLLPGGRQAKLIRFAPHVRVLGLECTFRLQWWRLSVLGHSLRCSFWLLLMCSERAVSISPWIER